MSTVRPHTTMVTGMALAYMSVPDAYGVVEAGVYRSKALELHNLPFLLHLQLRTVLYLSNDSLVRPVIDFLNNHTIKLMHLGVGVWMPEASWKPISEELIKYALEIVLDVTNHPILVMCSLQGLTVTHDTILDMWSCLVRSGIHQTGTVVGCLRRLQQWNLTPILEEYRRYAKSKARYANEQFMELFDEDLVTLPEHLPAWFIDQRRMMEEEEAAYMEQLQQEQSCQASEEEMPDGLFTTEETTTEVLADSEQPKLLKKSDSYKKYYYSSSSPLTTENRSYKRKIIGKV